MKYFSMFVVLFFFIKLAFANNCENSNLFRQNLESSPQTYEENINSSGESTWRGMKAHTSHNGCIEENTSLKFKTNSAGRLQVKTERSQRWANCSSLMVVKGVICIENQTYYIFRVDNVGNSKVLYGELSSEGLAPGSSTPGSIFFPTVGSLAYFKLTTN